MLESKQECIQYTDSITSFDYRGCPQMLPHAIRQKDPAKNIESRKDMTLFLLVLPLHLPSFFFDSLKVIHFDTAVSEYS